MKTQRTFYLSFSLINVHPNIVRVEIVSDYLSLCFIFTVGAGTVTIPKKLYGEERRHPIDFCFSIFYLACNASKFPKMLGFNVLK